MVALPPIVTLLGIGLVLNWSEPVTSWKTHFELSVELDRQGNYRGAAAEAMRALSMTRDLDLNDSRRIESFVQAARCQWRLGQYGPALAYLDNADDSLKRHTTPLPLLQARSWTCRANILYELGLGAEAKTLAAKAYAVQIKHQGADSSETLEALQALELAESNEPNSKTDGLKSFRIREKLYGKDHPEMAHAELHMARLRRYGGPEKPLLASIPLFKRMNPEHGELPEVLFELAHNQRLGYDLRTAKDFAKVEQNLKDAIAAWERIQKDHPRAARAVVELAILQGEKGNGAEAQRIYKAARRLHFSSLSDQVVCELFSRIPFGYESSWDDHANLLSKPEAYLGEMLDRGGPVFERMLAPVVKNAINKRRAVSGVRDPVPRTLEMLTALRRLQGKRDPVAVETDSALDLESIFPNSPQLSVNLQNQDLVEEQVGFKKGGDYRSGRQERWRIEALDAKENQVTVRQRLDGHGGGLHGYDFLSRDKTWGTRLHFNSFLFLVPGDYRIRIQYHDDDQIAHLDWLADRIVCQSEEIHLHVQPRVLDLAAKENELAQQLIQKLGDQGLRMYVGRYAGKAAHEFIAPDSPPGQLLRLGWKAVPAMIDATVDDKTPPRRRAWLLGLLYSITNWHDPTEEEGVLPGYRLVRGYSLSFGKSGFSSGWGEESRLWGTIDLPKQIAFARRWREFRKYIVVRVAK